MEKNITRNITSVQKELRQNIVKNVEINLFFMSLALLIIYIPIIGLLMIDIIEFLKKGGLISKSEPPKVIKYLSIYVCVYPLLESFVCCSFDKTIKKEIEDIVESTNSDKLIQSYILFVSIFVLIFFARKKFNS
ncbi:hypothetical protein HZS_4853 [Henneguya salminicola]|nr:hypothetical protein HZS_4853 [Henneguya salminicola]